MIEEAVDYYNSLLSGPLLEETAEALDRGTRERHLSFRGRPICRVLRPLIVTATRYRQIMQETETVLSAIGRVGAALPDYPEISQALGLTPEERELASIEPGYFGPDASGRIDGFLDCQGEIRFVEYNADSPGGLLFGEEMSDIFLDSAIIREFSRRYPVRAIDIRNRLIETLLSCYREWMRYERKANLRVAIVDWDGVATRREFELCLTEFATRGIPAIITTPDELEYRGGWLRAGDFRITLVYKRVVLTELIERFGTKHPLIRAARERAACVVNGFRVQALTQKSLFAVLGDPQFEGLFSTREIGVLRRDIPWTRLLCEGFSTWNGQRIDLIEFALRHREQLVLKPTASYGAQGVTIGWDCEESAWRQKIEEAAGGRFVIQERVEIPRRIFPIVEDGQLRFETLRVDFSPYTWRGEVADGAGIRLSPSDLLSVSSGQGSAAPLLIC